MQICKPDSNGKPNFDGREIGDHGEVDIKVYTYKIESGNQRLVLEWSGRAKSKCYGFKPEAEK